MNATQKQIDYIRDLATQTGYAGDRGYNAAEDLLGDGRRWNKDRARASRLMTRCSASWRRKMPHNNRSQVRVPRRLWDEMMLALDQSLARIEVLSEGDPAVVTRQVYEFGQRVLAEARRRTSEP